MTKQTTRPLLVFFLLAVISNCSDNDKAPARNRISFKAGAALESYEDNDNIFVTGSSMNCILKDVPTLDRTRYAEIVLCWEIGDDITGSDIESLEDQELPFESLAKPIPEFLFMKDGVEYASYKVDDQTGSKLSITSARPKGGDIFELTGTFNVNVADQYDGTVVAITEGAFVIRIEKP